MRELDTSTKRKWVNRRAVDIFGKKWIPLFSSNGKFPLVERQQNSWRVLHHVAHLEHILCGYERHLAKILLANSKRTSTYPTKIGMTAWFPLSPLYQLFLKLNSEMAFSRHELAYVLLFANWYLQSIKQAIYRSNCIDPIWLIDQGVKLLVTRITGGGG